MNMKIKIKNKDNKLFIALVLIAALMMVSVAGVVMSDDSRGIEVPMVNDDQDFIIKATDTGTIFELYPNMTADGSATYTYTIPNTITFSGTFSVGTMQSGTFVPVHSVTLTDVSSAVIAVSAEWDTEELTEISTVDAASIMITTYDTTTPTHTFVTTGTFEVTKGVVSFGDKTGSDAYSGAYFTGTSNGVEMVNILGLTITNASGTIGLSGLSVVGGDQLKVPAPAEVAADKDKPKKFVDSKLTITKNVTIGTLNIAGTAAAPTTGVDVFTFDNDVEVIIKEDVVATVVATPKSEYGIVIDTNYSGTVSPSNVTLANGTVADGTGGFTDFNKITPTIYTDPFTNNKSIMLDNISNQATSGSILRVAIKLGDSTYNGTVLSDGISLNKYEVLGFGTGADAVQGLGATVTDAGRYPTLANPIGYETDATAGAITLLYNLKYTNASGVATAYSDAFAFSLGDMTAVANGKIAKVDGTTDAITDSKAFGKFNFTGDHIGAATTTTDVVIVLEKTTPATTTPDVAEVISYDYYIATIAIDATNDVITSVTVKTATNVSAIEPVAADTGTSTIGQVASVSGTATSALYVDKTIANTNASFGYNLTLGPAAPIYVGTEGILTAIGGATSTIGAKADILIVQEVIATGVLSVGIVRGEYTGTGGEIALAPSTANAVGKTIVDLSTTVRAEIASILTTENITVTFSGTAPVSLLNEAGTLVPDTLWYAGVVPNGKYKLTITAELTNGNIPANVYSTPFDVSATGEIDPNEFRVKFKTIFSNTTAATYVEGRTTLSTLNVSVRNTMDVDGSLISTGTATQTKITSAGTINVEGMITTTDDLDSGINAVTYTITVASPASTTHYYTTLAKAMTNYSTITVLGTVVIKEDTELGGNSTATPIANNVIIGSSADLMIGVASDPDDSTVVAATAVVTVPTTTTLTIEGGGEIYVENGQFKWTAASAPTVNTSILSDVYIVEDKTAIYTDLTTSLTLATDGSTVTLRSSADVKISTAATVAKGVTLQATDIEVNINAGGKLTVDGKFVSTGNVVIDAAGDGKSAGEFVVNSKDVTFGSMELSGVYTINSGIVFSEDASITVTAATESIPAVMNVNGTYTNTGTIAGDTELVNSAVTTDYVTINVSGKYVSSAITTTNFVSKVFVTGEFNAASNVTINELTVTGSGKVTVSNYIVLVTKSAYLGDAATSTSIAASTNNTEVKITLSTTSGTLSGATGDSGAFAVVYGKPADGKVVISNSNPVTTEIVLGANEMYATVYATTATGPQAVRIVDIKDPAIIGFVFNGFYTSSDYAENNEVDSTKLIGQSGYTKIYAKMDIQKFVISFKYDMGIKWLLDGVEVEGNQQGIAYGQHAVSFIFMDGYSGDVKLTMNGNSYKAGDNFTLDENGNEFNSEGAHKTVPGNSMDMIEILLIVITIVFVIVAIVVIMRLMRS